jgi:hypothetical protein
MHVPMPVHASPFVGGGLHVFDVESHVDPFAHVSPFAHEPPCATYAVHLFATHVPCEESHVPPEAPHAPPSAT